MENSRPYFSLAAEGDLPDIISLWQVCFYDEEALVRRFFDSIRLRENVIIAKMDNRVVAHTSAVPIELRLPGRKMRGIYIYAACVSPENRGMGIFRQLMDYVDRYAAERELDFIMLIPASLALAETYRRFGYSCEIGGIAPVGESKRYGLVLSSEELSVLSLSDFDGDYDRLYQIYIQNEKKGFIKPRGFFEYTLRESIPAVKISMINRADNTPAGFVVTSPAEGKKLLNILQIVFSDDINNDIIANIKKKSTPYPKALCKMCDGSICDFSDIMVDMYGEF
ncbi:MAG: GNAT family N-acetyltransferase [Clostridiales bacterium]|nr:GNAT family N-acetyltransferase [Clostridiales bacterium]